MFDKPTISPPESEITTAHFDKVEIPGFEVELQISTAIQAKQSDEPDKKLVCEDGIEVLADHYAGVLVDGVGGFKNADLAAQIALAAVKEVLTVSPAKQLLPEDTVRQQVSESIKLANQAIFEHNMKGAYEDRIGTTAVVAQFCQAEEGLAAIIGWLGDSRAYLKGPNGEIEQLTVDDGIIMQACDGDLDLVKKWQTSFVNTDENTFDAWFTEFCREFAGNGYVEYLRDKLMEEDERSYEQKLMQVRKDIGRIIVAGLGVMETVHPHIIKVIVPAGWSLVLCSDGISDVLLDPELSELAKAHPGTEFAQATTQAASDKTGLQAKNDDRSILDFGLLAKPAVVSTPSPE